MKTLFGHFACAWFLLVCAGCAQSVAVTVSGTNKSGTPIPPHVTYIVLPTNEVEKDPAFPEYARLVENKMDTRGYKKTSEKTAQLGVFVAYGTRAGASGTTISPGGSTTGMGGGMSGGMSPGSSGGGGYGMAAGTPATSTGQRLYTNQVVIVVVDLQKSGSAGSVVELWRGETMNTGGSNDLAQLAPVMVDAAFKHFGDTTPNMARHLYNEEEIKKIRESK